LSYGKECILMFKNYFYGFVYFVWFLVFFELVARLIVSNDYIFNKIKGIDDSSNRLEWVHKKVKGKEFCDTLAIYNSTIGWALQPNLNHVEAFKNVVGGKYVCTNSKGIRGEDEYDYSKPKGKSRILVLGDSFTFGEEVNDIETFSSVLQEKLPDVEVINFGVFGYGHDQMLIYLKEEGIKYKPDLIILGFVGDDMRRNLLSFRDYAKPKFFLTHDGLKLTNYPVPNPSEILDKEIIKMKFLDLVNILVEKLKWRMGINDSKMEKLSIVILDEIIKQSEEIGAEVLFLYIPTCYELAPGIPKPKYEKFFVDYCSKRDINYLNLRHNFLEVDNMKREDWGYPHWNAKAHSLAGRIIFEYLQKNHILKNVTMNN